MNRCIIMYLMILSQLGFSINEKRIIYGESTKLTRFDPYTVRESAAHRLSDLLFDSLVTIGAGGSIKPHIAKDWTIENGGTAVSLHIREKVFWHQEGDQPLKPVTSDDIVTTIRLLKAPGSEIPNKELYETISRVDVISKFYVRIQFSRALAQPLKFLLFKLLPHHKLAATESLRKTDAFTQKPVGTGPYSFEKVTPQGEILLKRNPFYFKGLAAIKEIIMKPYLDRHVMTQSFMYRSLDLLPYLSPKYITEVRGDHRLNLIPYAAQSFSFIAMNQNNHFLKDLRVRKAISHAINRKEMLSAFFQSQGYLISGPFSPSSWAYNLKAKGYDYDPQAATMLLKKAGFQRKSPKELLTNSNNEVLKLKFAIPLSGEQDVLKRIVLAIQSYLQNIGIAVELKFFDWQVWKSEVIGKRNYDLTIASWDFDDSSNITSLFHSRNAKPWGNNFVNYRNPSVDTMLIEANITNDFDKRRAIYQQLHKKISSDAPYVFLWTLKHHAAHSREIANLKVEPFAFFKHVTEWQIK